MTSGENRGAKPAVQKRSQRTRDAIIAALEALLREKDFEAISIADIAARAGVSPASIYQRFSNKDAAVAILLELYVRRVAEWSRSEGSAGADVGAATSLRDALVAVGRASWRQFEELRAIMRPAYLYSRLRPDLLGAQWTAQLEQAHTGFRGLLERHKSEIRRGDLDRAAGMTAYFYNMMFLGVLLHGDERTSWDMPKDATAFAEELADFACGYLSHPDG